MPAHRRGIIFRQSAMLGKWLAARCSTNVIKAPKQRSKKRSDFGGSLAFAVKAKWLAQRPNSAAGIAMTDIGGIDTVSVEGTAICSCRTANIRAATERTAACSGT